MIIDALLIYVIVKGKVIDHFEPKIQLVVHTQSSKSAFSKVIKIRECRSRAKYEPYRRGDKPLCRGREV